MADLRYLARAGLGDTTGTTVMITERVRRVMDIMATEPVVPEVRAVALHGLARIARSSRRRLGWLRHRDRPA